MEVKVLHLKYTDVMRGVVLTPRTEEEVALVRELAGMTATVYPVVVDGKPSWALALEWPVPQSLSDHLFSQLITVRDLKEKLSQQAAQSAEPSEAITSKAANETSSPRCFKMPEWSEERMRELADSEPGGLMACSPDILSELEKMAKTDASIAAVLYYAGIKREQS